MKGERVQLNVALQQSGDEQLLLNLVRLRYRDTPAFLEVSGISTQTSFEASLEGGVELERSDEDSRNCARQNSLSACSAGNSTPAKGR